jgi:prepilin-type N-terminal cleavage/methylation domain-containing protein
MEKINKKCLYKKGFTLIELLAVIIILAIIALITTPVVLNIVDNANKKANKASAYGLLDAAKLYYSESLLDSSKLSKIDGTTNLISDISVSGQKPDSGSIYINSLGEIYLEVKYGDVCYKKGFSDSDLTESNDTNCGLEIPGTNDTNASSKVVPEDSCFTYETNDTGITITGYTCGATSSDLSDGKYIDITIPSTINGQTVTQIGNGAFYPTTNTSSYISSVVIPEGVTTIGNVAFGWNQITSVVIPSSVTSIYEGAFNNNQLSDAQAFIYKRNSDGSIDYTTIVSYGGAKRDNVVIPSGVTTISNTAFAWNQITSVTIPSGVTTIGSSAFMYNSLTSITIPEGVTTIGLTAFLNNQLTSVTIPNSVTKIDLYAFVDNPDMTITIDNTTDAISGSPWGASNNSTITYLR